MAEPLIPCPCCGSPRLRIQGFTTTPRNAPLSRAAIHHVWVECAHCGMQGPQVDYPGPASTAQNGKVIHTWNDWTRRLPQRALSDRRNGPAIR